MRGGGIRGSRALPLGFAALVVTLVLMSVAGGPACATAAAVRYRSGHRGLIGGARPLPHNSRPLTPAKPFSPLAAHQKTAPPLSPRPLDAPSGALKRATPANVVIGGMTDAAASIST